MISNYLRAIGITLMISPLCHAQSLEEFRGPSALESAYVGVAAALEEPALCSRISPIALNRVRKPALTRSLCFYHVALATDAAELCADVQAIPTETGMMTWLDPMRCQQHVHALADVQQPVPRPTHLDEFFEALGYQDIPDTKPGQIGLFNDILSNPARKHDLIERLSSAPDFSNQISTQDGFTEADALHETNWVLGRALRLCAAGQGGNASCDDDAIALVREQGLRRVGLAPPAAASGYRRPTSMEDAFIVLADMLRDSDLCDAMGEDVLSIGWSDKPGLEFVTSRSACRMRVAETTRNPDSCKSVIPITDPTLDGARATEAECRRAVESGEPLFPPPSINPDWPIALSALGYGSDLARDDLVSWNVLASRLTNPAHDGHSAFRALLTKASKAYQASEAETDKLDYTKVDLQLAAYQFAATRFHCSIDWSDVAEKTGAAEQSYWTPERPTFSLLNHDEQRVTEKDYAGTYTLAYFGFTSCPDICPISLATIRAALGQLEDKRDQIKPLFFTLDPNRDTPEVLADYVSRFGEDFSALTGTREEVDRAARSFNVYYHAGEIDGIYTVEHTSYYYLVDPSGETIKYFEYGVNAKDMAAELKAILAGEAPSPGGEVRSAESETKRRKWFGYEE